MFTTTLTALTLATSAALIPPIGAGFGYASVDEIPVENYSTVVAFIDGKILAHASDHPELPHLYITPKLYEVTTDHSRFSINLENGTMETWAG